MLGVEAPSLARQLERLERDGLVGRASRPPAAALGAIIALSSFVILTLDLPFTGGVSVKPDAMRSVIAGFSPQNF